MKVGLILECGGGGPDQQVCVYLIRRVAPQVELTCVTLSNKPRLIAECGAVAATLLRDGCERVVIVWDLFPAWRKPGETHCRGNDRTEIFQALANLGLRSPPVGDVLDLDFHCSGCHADALFEGGRPWYLCQFPVPIVRAIRSRHAARPLPANSAIGAKTPRVPIDPSCSIRRTRGAYRRSNSK